MACFNVSSNKEKSLVSRAASGSNHVDETLSADRSGGKVCKGKALTYASAVERIGDRLRILEEEVDVMKRDFIEGMEERKKLMNEISQQFQVLKHYLRSGNHVSADGVLIVNPRKNGRGATGLSQLLHWQSNPSLFIRDPGANMGAFEVSADTDEP
ncbi:uncharacterized protein LOC130750358 [Actinidia eriantha]|uniref:uncharacterized protein LOC130750358 n=1 Tax=Actinidia eriantha TaxID=165200 RepID=UPI00258B3F1A|nr:uncharacterized protein LOC130750358 [Actinidia eriantha]